MHKNKLRRMSLKCRIYKDENGEIDFVEAANGSRSKLFDTLVDITGGNKNTALNLYALTEVGNFKDMVKAKVNSIKNRVDNLVKPETALTDNLDAVKFSRITPNSTYFSNALTAVDNLTDRNPKNTQGWVKQLTDTQKNGGIKNVNQELEWIGLEDYLNSYVKENNTRAGNIPASVVEDYIKANQIEITDVSKGKPEIDINDLDVEFDGNGFKINYSGQGNLIMPYITIDQIGLTEEDIFDESFDYYSAQENAKKAAIEEVLDREDGDVKYGNYQLKGGENYREVLLTMPAKTIENDKVFTVKNRKDFWKDSSNFSAQEVEEGFVVSSVRGGRQLIEKDYYIKTKEDAINAYREDNLQLLDIFSEEQGVEDYDFYDENGQYFNTTIAQNIEQAISEYKSQTSKKEDEYKSSHWSEGNILAHVRLNEKTLPDGTKVLIVNEIQSDWAQDGRKKGFVDNVGRISREAYEIEEKAIEEEAKRILGSPIPNIADLERVGTQEALDLARRVEENTRQFLYLEGVSEKEMQRGKIQQMPYKKTDQWVGLATRRVLQMAAQEGYNGVAFVTGKQSSDMYSLAKQVDEITAIQNMSNGQNIGTYSIYGLKDDTTIFSKYDVPENELESYVGKDLAKTIIEENRNNPEYPKTSFKGTELEVGGEGMKSFYNSIVTKVAQKEAQRFDKDAKLETINFSGKSNVEITEEEDGFVLRVNGEFVEYVDEETLSNSNLDNTVVGAKKYFEKYIPQEVNAEKLTLAEQPYIEITNKMRSELKSSIPMFSRSLSETSKNEITQEIISKLELSGLANNVYQMSNSQIEAKLIKLGLDSKISKQVTMSAEDVDSLFFNAEEDLWEVNLVDGSYLEVYLSGNSTEQEVKDEVATLIREYKVDSLPLVYRGINGEFDSNYKGTQYFAVQKRYAGVFGRNIEEFKIKSPDILDLDDWNKRWGVEKVDFGQGLLTVHQDNLSDLKEWRTRIKNSLLAEGVEVSKEELDSFIKEVENAKIIKGEDIGNKGQIVFAIKDKTLVEPINKDIKFSKQLLEKGIKLSTAGFTYRGDVYLNNDVMGLDTPIHEFGHLHLDWLKENREDLYKSGLSLVGKNKEEAQQYIDIVKSTQPDLEEGTEEFNNEVLAQVIGDQGAKLLLSNKKGSLSEWLKSVWDAIKSVVGLSNYTAEQVSAMTLAEFGSASATELLSGSRVQKNLGIDSIYLRYNYDVNQVARDRFDIPNLVKLSQGSDRVVFDLGEDKVLKVANNARGLAQNMQEGNEELIDKGLLPQVYETGLNYVVAEKLTQLKPNDQIPIYNIVNGEQYGTEDAEVMIMELYRYSQADFDNKNPELIEVLKNYGLEDYLNYDIIYGDLGDISNWGIKDGKPVHLDAGTFGGMNIIRAYARVKNMYFEDFREVYEKSQEAKKRFNDSDNYVNFSIVDGNKLFNVPLEDASKIADEYMLENGMSIDAIEPIKELNKENSKSIAAEFDKMQPTPNDPKTKAAYKAMVKETIDQYKKILSYGYKLEINNSEPYENSADMITDLRDNKRMKIFSTESGFGDEAITPQQRKDNPLLQKTKFKDVNGEPLLPNDIFRFVHDFFGHAKFGNGFGALGEENAWSIHSRMYSPLARLAMTTETRGQNSWVNFSGVNDKAFEIRDRARAMRRNGDTEGAKILTNQVYDMMSFAEQKVGLLPSWVSELNIKSAGERMVADVNGSKVYFRNEVNPITEKPTGKIEMELVETPEEFRGQGRAREAFNTALKYTDSIGKSTVLTISSRDKSTTNAGLEKFYTSLGYKKTSDFEMQRPAMKLAPKGYDENGEPSVKDLMQYKDTSTESLSLEDQVVARNAAMALGVNSSSELLEKLESAITKSGIVSFNLVSLQRSGVFNKYEATKIVSSPELQSSIKEAYLKLKNTDPFELEYNKNFITPTGTSLNIFGKQEVENPFIVEAELARDIAGLSEEEIVDNLLPDLGNKYVKDSNFKASVDNIAKNNRLVNIKVVKDGELVDKSEDIENTIANTLIDVDNPRLSENIRSINEDFSPEVWDENPNLVVKILASIKKNAIKSGIDLRDITTKVLSHSREDILMFLDSMENLLEVGPNAETIGTYSELYKELFDVSMDEAVVIQTDNEFDIVVESSMTEYQLFDNFGLVKKQGDIYRQTEEQSLEELYDAMLEYPEMLPNEVSSIEDLTKFVEKEVTSLEISDYEIDPDKLAKMYLYKKFFGFPIAVNPIKVSTDNLSKVTSSPEYLITEFVKDFNRWILETDNKYFKVTEKGIELVEKDPLSKEEAIMSVPEEFVKDLSEYDAISKNLNLGIESKDLVFEDYDSQTGQREFFANNPESAKKVSGDYLYLEDGVLAVKNETDTFVRTPQGVFEMIYEAGNVKFYNKLPSVDSNFKLTGLEKPLSDINFNKYQYLENTPEVFKVAKNYYSKQELEQIDREYFDCQ